MRLVPFPLFRRSIQDAACVPLLLSLFLPFASGLEIIRTSVQETFSSKLPFVRGRPSFQSTAYSWQFTQVVSFQWAVGILVDEFFG